MLSLPIKHKSYQFLFVLFSLLSFMANLSKAQNVVLTEIMFNTTEPNTEFIEIFNPTNNTVDLENFKIKYHTVSPDEIIPVTSNTGLLPNQYAVIFEGDYDFENGIYNNIIPENALIFKLEDNAFGSNGMANTSNRKIYFLNAQEDTVNAYTYTADNSKDFSDERIDNSDSLWGNSKIKYGTPGKKNSVSKVEYDLALTKFKAKDEIIIQGDSTKIEIMINNIGTAPAENFTISVFIDNNRNYAEDNNENIFNEFITLLNSSDSLKRDISIKNLSEGNNYFIAQIDYSKDEFNSNNTDSLKIKVVSVNEEPGDLVINEFMYAPQNNEPEWIELFNKSAKEINLRNYQIADNSSKTKVISTDIILQPKNYIVFSADSSITDIYLNIQKLIVTSFPRLNNSGDDIVVLDSLDRVIDSLSYNTAWGGNSGKSVERISAELPSNEISNWRESIYPTPGEINSVTQKDFDLVIDTVFTNPKFPMIDEFTNFIVKVKNIGKNTLDFSITMFDDLDADSIANNILETTDNFVLPSNDSINIDLKNEILITSQKSNYIFRLQTNDNDTTNNYYIFKLEPSYPAASILINEIMYAPVNFEPEWIELYNNSIYDIDITEWLIGDILTNPVFKKIDEYIFPKHTYLVITKSRSIYEFHRSITSAVIELPFANLNNDEDGVVLKDKNERTIDSVKYKNDWGGTGGKSLERVNINFSSVNQNNWKSSIDLEGSTPGRINSTTPKDYDLSITGVSTYPKFPVENDSVFILVNINNFGNFTADNFLVDFSYRDKFINTKIEEVEVFSLAPNDSIQIKTKQSFFIEDTLTISANIVYEQDEDKINNYIEKIVVPGFNSKTVLINEIMFKPVTGNPEWIEIINNSDITIDLQNWLIGDLSGNTIITEQPIILLPGEYLIISDYHSSNIFDEEVKVIQTNFPNLNNTKDAVIIYDFRNAAIDSVYYNVTNDFSIGTSLERVSLLASSTDLTNWTFSLSTYNKTPGKENSINSIPDFLFDDMVFTEIMFNPFDTNSEFIEIYNHSGKDIEIGGWKIEDDEGKYFNTINKSYILQPNNYFVISSDSLIFENYNWLNEKNNISILNISSLNLINAGKKLYLKDIRNNIIDSLTYSEKWHNSTIVETKNISLEVINHKLSRNNSSNWSSSVNEFGATPDIENSINVENIVSKAKLEISPNPFSPDNDGFEDFTHINYNLSQAVSTIRVRIYDSKGRLIRTLANNYPSAAKGTIIFDGLDNEKNPLRVGIYIILLEAINSNNKEVEVLKEVVVVARKL